MWTALTVQSLDSSSTDIWIGETHVVLCVLGLACVCVFFVFFFALFVLAHFNVTVMLWCGSGGAVINDAVIRSFVHASRALKLMYGIMIHISAIFLV